MIKTLIYSLLERRHYWRYVSFSEIAEIYASRTLRVLAVSMVSVFIFTKTIIPLHLSFCILQHIFFIAHG
jgi:FlaA1/EpsC-like NDP-sugar epimerase